MKDEIPTKLYDRVACWLADQEDSTLLEETVPVADIDQYLIDEAANIFYELYQVYNNEY